MIETTNNVKKWAVKTIDSKISESEKKLTNNFNQKMQSVKELFNVIDLIGEGCLFRTYGDFVRSRIKHQEKVDDRCDRHYQDLMVI